MYSYQFVIADTHIKITTPYEIEIETRHQLFEKNGNFDIEIQFLEGNLKPTGKKLFDSLYYSAYMQAGHYSIYKKEDKDCFPFAGMIQKNESHYICVLEKKDWWRVKTSGDLFEIMDWEYILNQMNILLLHASYINWNEKGILFSGPSGIGKSTQADLWVQYEDVDIINGDRAGIRNMNGCWYAYGLPYAGSSHIFRNEKRKIRAIVILRKGENNELRRLKEGEAFRYLYQESIVQPWVINYMDRLLDLLIKLSVEIPVYYYSCRPDKSAVYTLKKQLEGSEY